MTRDRIIEKVLNDISVDPRVTDGIIDIHCEEHVNILREYLVERGIEESVVNEFCDGLITEKGKYPERQAYNRKGILVTFPTPEYKKAAIQAGTHFEEDPTRGHPNIFASDEKPPATEPPPAAAAAQAAPTKTKLPVSTSTAAPPPSETGGEDPTKPAQQIPTAFTTAAPQQSPAEEPEEPTKLPPPKPAAPKEKEANKDAIKKILKGDDYMLEEGARFPVKVQLLEMYINQLMDEIKNRPDTPLKEIDYRLAEIKATINSMKL